MREQIMKDVAEYCMKSVDICFNAPLRKQVEINTHRLIAEVEYLSDVEARFFSYMLQFCIFNYGKRQNDLNWMNWINRRTTLIVMYMILVEAKVHFSWAGWIEDPQITRWLGCAEGLEDIVTDVNAKFLAQRCLEYTKNIHNDYRKRLLRLLNWKIRDRRVEQFATDLNNALFGG